MKNLLVLLTALLFSTTSFAADDLMNKGGVLLGNVALNSDANSTGMSNTLGYGAFVDFAASDMFLMELSGVYSTHTGNGTAKLTQTDISVSPILNLTTFDVATPFLTAGVNLINRNLDLGGAGTASGSGFGVNIGLGVDFNFGEQFVAGLMAKYVNAFEQNVTVNGASVKLMSNYTDIMARFGVRF